MESGEWRDAEAPENGTVVYSQSLLVATQFCPERLTASRRRARFKRARLRGLRLKAKCQGSRNQELHVP